MLRGYGFQRACEKERALQQASGKALVAVCPWGDGQSCVGQMELVGVCCCTCLCSSTLVDHAPLGLAQRGGRMT